jgi:hypothetical protein
MIESDLLMAIYLGVSCRQMKQIWQQVMGHHFLGQI